MHGVAEIGIQQQRIQRFQVIRHPAVVVAQIGDNSARGMAQSFMPMDLPHARTFGKIEEPYSRVFGRQIANDDTCRLLDSVAHNEQLEILQRLLLHARYRVAQRLHVIVSGDQDRC
jgi:hypothetical protein